MACELASTCIFFNEQMATKPGMLALYKAQYCRGDNRQCARYMVYVAMGREAVPTDMYPNDRLRATRIVRAGRCESDRSG